MHPGFHREIWATASKGVNVLLRPWVQEKADAAVFLFRKRRGDETRGLG